MIFIPWYDIKVATLRLQMISQDLPAQFDAPSLAGCSMGGTAHLGGSEGGLRHLQDVGVIVITEQLQHAADTKRLRRLNSYDLYNCINFKFKLNCDFL